MRIASGEAKGRRSRSGARGHGPKNLSPSHHWGREGSGEGKFTHEEFIFTGAAESLCRVR